MGLLDKAKGAATAAMATAQQAAQQGQAKVGAYQQSRSEAELYRTLGEVFYREQRQGGEHEAVVTALTNLDAYIAQAAQAASAQAAQAPSWPQQPAPSAAPTPGEQSAGPAQPASAAGQPTGNFTLDDF